MEKPAKRPCTRSLTKRREILPAHCPICLESDEATLQQLVGATNCQKHACCLSCYERILLPDYKDFPDCLCVNCTNSGLEGNCPVCKASVSLFDLRSVHTGEWITEQDMTKTPLAGARFVEQKRNNANEDEQEDGDELLETLFFPTKPSGAVTYFTTGSSAYANRPQHLELTRIQFHKASRSFYGVHDFPEEENPCFRAVTVTASFSYDYRFITAGRILWLRRDFDCGSSFRKAYPVDGVWECEILDEEGISRVQFRVKDGFRFCPAGHCTGPFHIMPDESLIAVFNGDEPSRLRWNFRDYPEGPPVGTTLQEESIPLPWREKERGETVSWKRLKIPDQDDYGTPVVSFGGDSKTIFQRSDIEIPAAQVRYKPFYNPDALWGNTFCDNRLCIGNISLHFISPTESFINWGNDIHIFFLGLIEPEEAVHPFPTRVALQDIVHESEHNFTASVYWLQEIGKPLFGSSRWTFSFRVDSRHMCLNVESIRVVRRTVFGSLFTQHRCPAQNFREDFFNASLFDAYGDDQDNCDFTVKEFRPRLLGEGFSLNSVAIVDRIFSAARKRNRENPVRF